MKVKVLTTLFEHITDLLPKATEHSAGFDLRAAIEEPITIEPGDVVKIPSGLAIMVTPGCVGLMFPRSGLGTKHGIVLGNLTGVIDADYQGEIQIPIWNRSDKPYTVQPAECVAQFLQVPLCQSPVQVVDDFDHVTERGTSGFGDSGRFKD